MAFPRSLFSFGGVWQYMLCFTRYDLFFFFFWVPFFLFLPTSNIHLLFYIFHQYSTNTNTSRQNVRHSSYGTSLIIRIKLFAYFIFVLFLETKVVLFCLMFSTVTHILGQKGKNPGSTRLSWWGMGFGRCLVWFGSVQSKLIWLELRKEWGFHSCFHTGCNSVQPKAFESLTSSQPVILCRHWEGKFAVSQVSGPMDVKSILISISLK